MIIKRSLFKSEINVTIDEIQQILTLPVKVGLPLLKMLNINIKEDK